MNALELRRRTLGKGVYKKTVEGNPAIAQGSLARRYPGITMQGWTEQAQYDGNQLFDASSVVDGIISNGEVVENGSFVTSDFISVIAGNVYSRSATGASGNFFYNADKIYLQNVLGTVNIEAPEGAAYVRFCINKNDFDIQDIMLNEGSTVLPYEPYTGGAPSPNPDYPQEIVSAGKYDEGTGKYQYTIKISDSEESPTKSQTVTLTSDRPLTKWDRLEKRNGQWGWVYKSNRIEMDGSETGFDEKYLPILILGIVPTGVSTDRGSSVKPRYDIWSNYTDILTWSDSACVRCSINLDNSGFSTIGVNSADTFKQWLAQKYSEGNSFYYEYETAEETFAPLTTAEQEQMNALYTFRPTTVLSNDCECNMKLMYKTKESMQSAPGGILKADGVTSEFIFPVKWNQVNKIALKISGISSNQSIFVCGANRQNIWIGLNNNVSMIGLKKAVYSGAPENEIVDGKYHEMIFTFEKPVEHTNISNIWDGAWSKNIIYHEIMFYDDDELLSDCVPYYKGAGYMLDKKNNIVIRASDPDAYQFA